MEFAVDKRGPPCYNITRAREKSSESLSWKARWNVKDGKERQRPEKRCGQMLNAREKTGSDG